jgi:hypothetical protein
MKDEVITIRTMEVDELKTQLAVLDQSLSESIEICSISTKVYIISFVATTLRSLDLTQINHTAVP